MRYKIADFNVEYEPIYVLLKEKMKNYESKRLEESIDIKLCITEELCEEKQKMYPTLTAKEWEYVYAGIDFNRKILDLNGIMIHSSAVEVDGKAYLFSASCGTGKSTHTKQWQKYFGTEKAIIINDDKPVLRRMEDGWYVYGTPFSGKTDENVNKKVKLQGICMLERGDNSIRRINPKEAIPLILEQTIRPKKNVERLVKMTDILNQLLSEIPFYRMQCDISEEAVKMAYEKMKEER